MRICMVCDPMLDVYGPVAPALLLAKKMVERNHQVSIVSTKVSDGVQKILRRNSLDFVNLDINMVIKKALSLSWLEVWTREAFFNLNSRGLNYRDSFVVNFSHTLAVPSAIWYVQGPTTNALADMTYELPLRFRFVYETSRFFLEFADDRLIRKMASASRVIIANSEFCASMYRARNLRVHRIIFPPLDSDTFKPTTSPSNDYVLAYLGKETDFRVLKQIGDAGVKIKIFGSKVPFKPKNILEHRNVEFLGRVSEEELVKLYSNALYTLFTFNHEPFGYVPVESMACGTPVLTYNCQGPSETVVNGVTGWLANTPEETMRLAIRLWRNGYSQTMRGASRKRALPFSVEPIAEEWNQVIEMLS